MRRRHASARGYPRKVGGGKKTHFTSAFTFHFQFTEPLAYKDNLSFQQQPLPHNNPLPDSTSQSPDLMDLT